MSRYAIRRGADRVRTRTEWLDSRHSFAFGPHYDPDNTGFGLLQAFNHDILQPGPGYPVHAHRDVEILSWVLAGALVHQDAAGTATLVGPGDLHHLSAGSGIRHTEFSAGEEPVEVVQMWLTPGEYGGPPRHRLLRVADRLASGQLVEIASGQAPDGAAEVVRLRQRDAALSVARLPGGAVLTLPAARYLHVYLTAGSATVESGEETVAALAAGDALRIAGGGGERVTAPEAAELLVWRMQGGIGADAERCELPGRRTE